jgi:peptide-methionine (S)-S-oxide reductase
MKHVPGLLIAALVPFLPIGCQAARPEQQAQHTTTSAMPKDLGNYAKAYFASGCFWCVEAVFESLKGVEEAVSGYCGGKETNPTYEEVGAGRTGHAESVLVYYDPAVLDYATLLRVFFGSQDPTTPNRQGPDEGAQYRSAIFFQNDREQALADSTIDALNASGMYNAPIVTQVVRFDRFWPAEQYHQNYERMHPENPYVRSVSIPRLNAFKQKFPALLKPEGPGH